MCVCERENGVSKHAPSPVGATVIFGVLVLVPTTVPPHSQTEHGDHGFHSYVQFCYDNECKGRGRNEGKRAGSGRREYAWKFITRKNLHGEVTWFS